MAPGLSQRREQHDSIDVLSPSHGLPASAPHGLASSQCAVLIALRPVISTRGKLQPVALRAVLAAAQRSLHFAQL